MKIATQLLLLGGLLFNFAFSQNCEADLDEKFQLALSHLNTATQASSKSDSESAIDSLLTALNHLATYSLQSIEDENCDKNKLQKLKADRIYNAAMYMIYVLQQADNFPNLNSKQIYLGALKVLGNARELYQSSGELAEGHHTIFRTYTNEGKLHSLFFDYDLAEESFNKGILEAEKYKGKLADKDRQAFLGDLLREIGQNESKKGAYHEALNYLFQALQHYELAEDNFYKAACLYRICFNYSESENFEECIAYGDKFKIFLPEFENDPNFQVWMMDVNLWLGEAYEKLGRSAKAFEELDKVIANKFADERFKGYAIGEKGTIWLHLGEFQKAEEALRNSIQIFSSTNLNIYKSRIALSTMYKYLGECQDAKKEWEKAILAYDSAQVLIQPHGPASPIWDEYHVSEILGKKAYAFFNKYKEDNDSGDLNMADSLYAKAMKLIDGLRSKFKEDNSKLFLSKKGQIIYEGAINVALAKNDFSRAFQIAENAKANLLYATLQDRVAREMSSLAPEFLNLEYNLKRQLALLDLKLRDMDSNDGRYTAMIAERAETKARLNELIAEIEAKDPAYFSMKYENKRINVMELQAALPQQTSLAEYFAGEDSWYVFLVDKEGIEVFKNPRNPQAVVEFFQICSKPNGLKVNREKFESLAFQLYQDLILPYQKELDKEVIIIPDGELNYLPFDVLFTEKAKSGDLPSTYPYWLRENAISYDFSAKLWMWKQENKSHSSWLRKNLLVFAPNFEALNPDQLNSEEQIAMKNPLIFQRPELREMPVLDNMSSSQEEAQRLKEIAGSRLWGPSSDKAILGSFLRNAPDYRFLHLATHAKFDSVNHKYSFLAFRPVDNGIDDERLYLDDLYRIHLPAEMVVLSACETQLGEYFPGEGNASLAHGFAQAGVKSIIATRWSINSEAKAQQMALFYEFLKKGYSKSEALRLSKIEILSQGSKYPSPYYWAAPIVMGNTESVSFLTIWSAYGRASLALLGVLFLILSLILFRRSKAGKRL
ncbi:MAG: CHAT domain-containing protein [Bacteroidia bacterium]|nr:CHAT domain-containing protein [Bacteroidia bacterium]